MPELLSTQRFPVELRACVAHEIYPLMDNIFRTGVGCRRLSGISSTPHGGIDGAGVKAVNANG